MGFEREVTTYRCGCYSEKFSHDFFNYDKDYKFENICGKHFMENQAMNDHHTDDYWILKNATDVLSQRMEPDNVIHQLRMKSILSKKTEHSILQIENRQMRCRELLSQLMKSKIPVLHQLKIAMIKSGQSELIQHLVKENNGDNDIVNSYDGSRCFIHLHQDTYVVAKEYKDTIYIHIRNYEQRKALKYPTKQGVALTLSRWLILESKKEEISRLYEDLNNGKLESDEYVMHLGGGIQVTVSSTFPTVDIRQFWKPDVCGTPKATKKGLALSEYKWKRLCDVMELIREFVPELDKAVMCHETHPNEIELHACKECYPFETEDDTSEISPNQEGDLELMKSAWNADF